MAERLVDVLVGSLFNCITSTLRLVHVYVHRHTQQHQRNTAANGRRIFREISSIYGIYYSTQQLWLPVLCVCVSIHKTLSGSGVGGGGNSYFFPSTVAAAPFTTASLVPKSINWIVVKEVFGVLEHRSSDDMPSAARSHSITAMLALIFWSVASAVVLWLIDSAQERMYFFHLLLHHLVELVYICPIVYVYAPEDGTKGLLYIHTRAHGSQTSGCPNWPNDRAAVVTAAARVGLC